MTKHMLYKTTCNRRISFSCMKEKKKRSLSFSLFHWWSLGKSQLRYHQTHIYQFLGSVPSSLSHHVFLWFFFSHLRLPRCLLSFQQQFPFSFFLTTSHFSCLLHGGREGTKQEVVLASYTQARKNNCLQIKWVISKAWLLFSPYGP